MRSLRRLSLCVLVISMASQAGGCRLAELFNGRSVATVKFFGTHAGTPDETGFPDHGPGEAPRSFVNDMGWTITLNQVFVTTTAVRLLRCGESKGTAIEMFWGPCPEDFIVIADRDTLPFGALTIDDGRFCGVDVVFGPYVEDQAADEHTIPSSPDVLGNTVVIRGIASRDDGMGGEESVSFEVLSAEEVVANIDISSLSAGGPLELEEEEFPVNVSILKTYDSFFEGIDFASAGPAELEATVLAALELDTRAYEGAVIPD